MPRTTGIILSRSFHQDFPNEKQTEISEQKELLKRTKFSLCFSLTIKFNLLSHHLKDLLKSQERSWQVNTQLPQPGEKQDSSLVIFLIFYMSLLKILLVLLCTFSIRGSLILQYWLTVVVLHCNVYIRLSVHRENEYNFHLQPLLFNYAHGTCVQDSQEHLCCSSGFPRRPLSKHLQLHSVSGVAQWGRTRAGFSLQLQIAGE